MMKERYLKFKEERYLYEMQNLGNFDRVYPLTEDDKKYYKQNSGKYEEFLDFSAGLFSTIANNISPYCRHQGYRRYKN